MKLPENSLGVSDAEQWHECQQKFHLSMQRHLGVEQLRGGVLSFPLAYGNALHDAAQEILESDNLEDVYVDDVLDVAWAKWSSHLTPESHAELKEDIQTVLLRSLSANNLELICCEEDMSVPLFTGREQGGALDEESVWYKYRFKIDALYRKKDDPTHYVIRDFKTTRQQMFQNDIDKMQQFTAYDFGIRRLFPDAKEVTIWYDQVKFREMFTSRDAEDRIKFEEYMRSTILSVLDTPEEKVANTHKLNNWCSWCPLLDSCGVLEDCTSYGLVEIARNAKLEGAKEASDNFIGDYEKTKQAIKALEEHKKRMNATIKNTGGIYGDKVFYESYVDKPTWKLQDIASIIGAERAIKLAPTISKQKMKQLLDTPLRDELMNIANMTGHSRIISRKLQESDKDNLDGVPF